MILTDEEKAIKAYLSDGDPLGPQILDMVIRSFWKQEPYMCVAVRKLIANYFDNRLIISVIFQIKK